MKDHPEFKIQLALSLYCSWLKWFNRGAEHTTFQPMQWLFLHISIFIKKNSICKYLATTERDSHPNKFTAAVHQFMRKQTGHIAKHHGMCTYVHNFYFEHIYQFVMKRNSNVVETLITDALMIPSKHPSKAEGPNKLNLWLQ